MEGWGSIQLIREMLEPVDYLYVYIYSWECYGEHGQVSSSLERCQDLLIICMRIYTVGSVMGSMDKVS